MQLLKHLKNYVAAMSKGSSSSRNNKSRSKRRIEIIIIIIITIIQKRTIPRWSGKHMHRREGGKKDSSSTS